MTQAFESYNQLRVLKRPLTGRLPVVLPDGDAADSRSAPPGWARTWPSGSRGRCRCWRRRRARSAPAASISASSRRATTSSARSSRRSTRWRASWRRAAARSSARRSSSSASTSRSKARRRYIETILERITTGVVSVDAGGAITTINSAAARLLSLDRTIVGQPARAVFDRADLQPLGALLAGAGARRGRAGRAGDRAGARRPGAPPGRGRDAARRRQRRARRRRAGARRRDAAHPRAEGRGLARGGAAARARDQESADADSAVAPSGCAAISPAAPPARQGARRRVHEHDRRRGRVAEGAGRRVLAVRADAVAADGADRPARSSSPTRSRSTTASSPTCASSSGSRRACRSSASTPSRSGASSSTSSTTRSRRWSAAAQIVVETQLDAANSIVRVVVADNGPGIPPAERDKLFLPYYSTKRRGSGLGLAIVRRIIAEHGGSIDVGDNTPRGTRFTIELPC